MKKYFSIGEFAKLGGITTETLRHYDRVGILKPIHVDDITNYRYYSVLQYERLAVILEMRNLGMKIEEIKDFLEERNPENAVKILKEQKNYWKRKSKI